MIALKPQRPAPIVKWVGGKRQLLAELAAHVPRTFGRYYEPMCGGAALFFHLAAEGRVDDTHHGILGDANTDLIETYRAIAAEPSDVIRSLKRLAREHNKRNYYGVRRHWNEKRFTTAAGKAAAFIYLNRTGFNGLWRVNRSGEFNVPMGRYKNPTICDEELICAGSAALSRAIALRSGDYQHVLTDAEAGDFVYLDPPYHPRNVTSNFTSYTADKFGIDEQRRLAHEAQRLVDRGVHVLLSNSDTRLVREIYGGFCIERVKARRSINSDAEKRGKIGELIIWQEGAR